MLTELNDDALRQYSDAKTAFLALYEAKKAAKEVRGSMFWREVGGVEYLIRANVSSAQKSLGRRTEETEAIYHSFVERKTFTSDRVSSLKETVLKHQRLNRALYVGHTPQIVIDLLNMLAEQGLMGFFTIVGTFALYAYETAAGVRIDNAGALATQDVDLLWHNGKRLQFFTHLNRTQERSMIRLLKKMDSSFQVDELDSGGYTATNNKAFQVDFIRAASRDGEPHPFAFSDDEDDLWPVPAKRAESLLSSPRLETVVVSVRGEMALMPTIYPYDFYKFKLWMATQHTRPEEKRRRDKTQAEVMLRMMKDYLPQYLPKDAPAETEG
ncbi:hypothetical protein HQ393_15815 [Chitinibacter bivalviorum]|uniref:Nucleotidyltransferase-like domain-containing protein n=1 Tax=Chitinibacter bivalviorum TaxID=2739434 RepID=A0A7H9BMG9_9NEIS|nr:GSU2403 family nucleotidyltransferase fold protein [Chitinibacter bivalviorum]QLG89596.1 hypothetical protein HQ393_15815 [Chitinibacter bivalviorum]